MAASVHKPTAPHYATIKVDRELRLVNGSIVGDDASELEIVRELARGGTSVVYCALDHRSAHEIALKVADADCNASAVARFHEEARLGAKVGRHPHIVRPLRAGQLSGPRGFKGRAYLAMELVPGDSLSAIMAAHRLGLPWHDACEIARDVAIGLEALHESGIVHRDIKPGNVLLTSDTPKRAKLIDLGLSYATGEGWTEQSPSLTQDGHAPGTLLYMSPEQLGHEKPAPSMDIYSFGVMLYEMFTGNPPYHRLSQAEMVAKKCDPAQLPYPVGKACPELDRRLADLVTACLSFRASDRPTATAARETLERVLAARAGAPANHGEVLTSHAAPQTDHAAPQSSGPRSRRNIAAAVIAVFALSAVGLIVWVTGSGQESSNSSAAVEASSQPAPSLAKHSATHQPDIQSPAATLKPDVTLPEHTTAPMPRDSVQPPSEPPPVRKGKRRPPDNPKAHPVAITPASACPADTPAAAEQARKERDWRSVLSLAKRAECWPSAEHATRTKHLTRAYLETERYADCVATGENSSDASVARWVAICKTHLEGVRP